MGMSLKDLIAPTYLEDVETSDYIFIPSDNDDLLSSDFSSVQAVGLAKIGFAKNASHLKDYYSYWLRDKGNTPRSVVCDKKTGKGENLFFSLKEGLRPCMELDIDAYLRFQEFMKQSNNEDLYAFYKNPEDKIDNRMLLDFGEYPLEVDTVDEIFKEKHISRSTVFIIYFFICSESVFCRVFDITICCCRTAQFI